LFGSFIGAVAHSGELYAGADVVQKESNLLVIGAARNPAGDEVANFRIAGPITRLFAPYSWHVVNNTGWLVVLNAAKIRVNCDHIAFLQGRYIGLEFSDRVVVHAGFKQIGREDRSG
jgi:hypothetical protein